MALDNKHKIWIARFKKALIIIVVAAVVIFNVYKFLQYAETNDRFIKDYASEQDALADYKNPLPAVFYFKGSQKYHKAHPVMMLIPNDNLTFLPQPLNTLKNSIQKYSNIGKTFIITPSSGLNLAENLKEKIFHNADIVTYDDKLSLVMISEIAKGIMEENSLLVWLEKRNSDDETKGVEAMLQIADEQRYRPYVVNLMSNIPVKVLEEKSPHISKSLDEQYQSLRQFKIDYAQQLKLLTNDVLQNEVKVPTYSKRTEHLFDRGNVLVAVKINDNDYVDFGNLFADKAVGRSLVNNLEAAKQEYPNLPYKMYLVTEPLKKNYKNEQDFFDDLQEKQDGIILVSGYRSATFLPYMWKKYPNKTEFIKNLKLAAGLNPDYWSAKIKVYFFRAVEIVDEN